MTETSITLGQSLVHAHPDPKRDTPLQKLPYATPKLTKYGDVASLTRGVGGSGSDNTVTSVG